MAWIESHQKLKEDPKLLDLMEQLSLNQNEAIGILHRFWWWCVDHTEDGDLRAFNNNQLGRVVGLNGTTASRFVEGMVQAGFLEREPYFRVANWWKFIGKYLQSKYKSTPKRWKKIQRCYVEVTQKKLPSNNKTQDLPNLTGPNLTGPTNQVTVPSARSQKAATSAAVWEAYREAYQNRYGVDPIRNARTNSHLVQVVKCLGETEAPHVAAYYLTHNQALYVRAKHPTNLLVRDCEGLRTEWATGHMVSDTEARDKDRRQTTASAFAPLLAEAEEKERARGR